ncbi:MAG: gamma-glutamylcyclotransferase family protein [Fluviibacter sp.]|jgi:gamma-glutamylcyclotransferase (GGCT)/AIG2-like uncharacterized protein YtfP
MRLPRIYAAYGSNLNHEQMARRCPNAEFIGTGFLQNYRLVFRRVADIEYAEDHKTPIGLWRVTDQCVKSLDSYEGFPRLYGRNKCQIYRGAGKYTEAFIYFMNAEGYEMPFGGYLNSIVDGYYNCGLNPAYIREALTFTEESSFLQPA